MMKTAVLTPELICSDFSVSYAFYTQTLGFNTVYERPEDGFAMLERQGARIMIEQFDPDSRWSVGILEKPYGRGINFQIETSNVYELYQHILKSGMTLFMPIEEKWYRATDRYVGNRQFLIQDPDGYLLRFFEDLGSRDSAP